MDGIIVNKGPLPSTKSYSIGNAFAEFGIPNHTFDLHCSTCKRGKNAKLLFICSSHVHNISIQISRRINCLVGWHQKIWQYGFSYLGFFWELIKNFVVNFFNCWWHEKNLNGSENLHFFLAKVKSLKLWKYTTKYLIWTLRNFQVQVMMFLNLYQVK